MQRVCGREFDATELKRRALQFESSCSSRAYSLTMCVTATGLRTLAETRQAGLYGSLGFLRRPQQDFAGEGLLGLSHNHGHGVGYVRGLQHFLGILS